MQRSIYLARLIGPVFIAIGLGLLLNGDVYRAMATQFLQNYGLIYLSGLIALVVGLALVNAHNVWVGDWRLIITILGWLALIGGAVRAIAPQWVESVGLKIIDNPMLFTIEGVVMIVLGAVLAYYGYANTSRARPRKLRR